MFSGYGTICRRLVELGSGLHSYDSFNIQYPLYDSPCLDQLNETTSSSILDSVCVRSKSPTRSSRACFLSIRFSDLVSASEPSRRPTIPSKSRFVPYHKYTVYNAARLADFAASSNENFSWGMRMRMLTSPAIRNRVIPRTSCLFGLTI